MVRLGLASRFGALGSDRGRRVERMGLGIGKTSGDIDRVGVLKA